jgi:hypothetical protein
VSSLDEKMVELTLLLERASIENASAFVVVAVDFESEVVLSTTGPFAEPEAALVQAGIDEAQWKRDTAGEPERDSIRWIIVPQWEPTPC